MSVKLCPVALFCGRYTCVSANTLHIRIKCFIKALHFYFSVQIQLKKKK
jgi:hypothetical protein